MSVVQVQPVWWWRSQLEGTVRASCSGSLCVLAFVRGLKAWALFRCFLFLTVASGTGQRWQIGDWTMRWSIDIPLFLNVGTSGGRRRARSMGAATLVISRFFLLLRFGTGTVTHRASLRLRGNLCHTHFSIVAF